RSRKMTVTTARIEQRLKQDPFTRNDPWCFSPREEVTTQVKTAPVFASPGEAAQIARAALAFLAAADPAQMTGEEQARCLHALERATAIGTAARAAILGAFTAGKGYSADGDYSPRSWLIHRTNVT